MEEFWLSKGSVGKNPLSKLKPQIDRQNLFLADKDFWKTHLLCKQTG